MAYLEPSGYVECEICGDVHIMSMIELAYDGDWRYDPDYLPEGWEEVDGQAYCAGCKKEAKDVRSRSCET